MNQVQNIYLTALLVSFSTVAMADENVTKEDNLTIQEPTSVVEHTEPVELSMEEQIKKALGEVEPMRVMKSAEPRILSESEAKVLDTAEPITRKKVVRQKRVRVKKRVKRVEVIDMDSLPMAKTYPMD